MNTAVKERMTREQQIRKDRKELAAGYWGPAATSNWHDRRKSISL